MVIIDTDIFIGALRDNAIAAKHLTQLKGKGYISVITELELLVGAKTKSMKKQAEEIVSPFDKLKFNPQVYGIAKRLLKEYNSHTRSLYMPDALIAATALFTGFALLTFNTKDFKFIKGLKLR